MKRQVLMLMSVLAATAGEGLAGAPGGKETAATAPASADAKSLRIG